MIEVRVEGLLLDSSNNSPVVLLRELEGNRLLPIYIGPYEASAIAYALQDTPFTRPLTLDLMKLLVEGLEGKLKRVIVSRIEDDTYYADVVVETQGRIIVIDARPSDSIGLALRTKAPIFVAEEVMDKAGQLVSPEDEEKLAEIRSRLRSLDPEQLGDFQL